MANYASLRGPVGLVRVFLDTDGQLDDAHVLPALKGGRGFVTNGPLLGLLLDGHKPGDTIASGRSVPYRVALRSPVPVDHLELVSNGEVVQRFDLTGDRTRLDASGEITLPHGGWLLLRAWNDDADAKVLDLYPYATTNPVWLQGTAPDAHADAAYFVAWLDRVIEAASARDDYNDATEKDSTLAYLREAQAKFRTMAGAR
jgi:TolB protein